MKPHDLVIRGATVYDGTGAPGFLADIGVLGDRIVALGSPSALGGAVSPGVTELDARGLAVAPGFIDVHSHDDFAVLLEPTMAFKVMQGVTTDVVGNCGLGVAPYEAACRRFARMHPGPAPGEWSGFGGYLARVDEVGPSLNVAVLMGHNVLRAGAMGDAARRPSGRELDLMRRWVGEGAAAGAAGLSTGLIYEPGCHAGTEELVALARELGTGGGLYATHLRDEAAGLAASVREAIEVGESAGVPVQISHLKAAGRSNWGSVRGSLQLIDEARGRGVDVTADQYPYTAGATSLAAVIANRAFGPDPPGGLGRLTASDVVVSSAPGHPEYEGRTIQELRTGWGASERQAAERLAREVGDGCHVVVFLMAEDDVRTVMAHPTTMIGSDGDPVPGKPHPRLYGCFPRVLGRYVRQESVLDLPTAVHRMTGLSASKFRLDGRGIVRQGAYADLVVFDPDTVVDRGDYEDPRRFPVGILAVYVNGVAVARDGIPTGARPGRALRRG